MTINPEHLYGIYEMADLKSIAPNGPGTDEKNAGVFIFMRDNTLAVVSGSKEWVMAYSGPFKLENDIFTVQLEACVYRDREGKPLSRKILHLDETTLIVEAGNDGQGNRTEITWKKKHAL